LQVTEPWRNSGVNSPSDCVFWRPAVNSRGEYPFKKGVLTVALPNTPETQKEEKKIAAKAI
jgi:hypothetical protein